MFAKIINLLKYIYILFLKTYSYFMGDTNFFSGVVQILETPKQHFVNNSFNVTVARAAIPLKYGKMQLIHLNFWGALTKNSYKSNDYILVEGYISLRDELPQSIFKSTSKQVTLTVLKVRPFFIFKL